jgi:aspartyl-tRNA(Asn)/glutamyl-tRNA(Gln) amidotransferase subunit B
VQETRHWDEDSGTTKSMRSKEEAFDYRYFPEPDIPSLEPDDVWVYEIRASLPELPRARRERYVAELGLKPETARVLVGEAGSVALFEGALELGADARASANRITQDVAALRNADEDGDGDGELTPRHIADLVDAIADGTVSNAAGKQALEEAFTTGDPIDVIVERRGLRQVSDAGELGTWADEVIAENPDVVEKFRSGKDGVIGFLLGQLMQKAGGAANPKAAQELLRERLQG